MISFLLHLQKTNYLLSMAAPALSFKTTTMNRKSHPIRSCFSKKSFFHLKNFSIFPQFLQKGIQHLQTHLGFELLFFSSFFLNGAMSQHLWGRTPNLGLLMLLFSYRYSSRYCYSFRSDPGIPR